MRHLLFFEINYGSWRHFLFSENNYGDISNENNYGDNFQTKQQAAHKCIDLPPQGFNQISLAIGGFLCSMLHHTIVCALFHEQEISRAFQVLRLVWKRCLHSYFRNEKDVSIVIFKTSVFVPIIIFWKTLIFRQF